MIIILFFIFFNYIFLLYIVLDAKDLSKGPICRLNCDRIIPYGFHGTFTDKTFIE
jgi:carotenoid cleavage dioxygenase-like enzyme